MRVDYLGFALVTLTFGSLEVFLDKGQDDDWFGSSFITTMVIVFAVSFAWLLYWEFSQIRRKEKPIIELRLLGRRTFAFSFAAMFIFGFVLYGSTILLPQFEQQLLGYTAKQAGMTLSIGGIATLLCMPIVGSIINRGDARLLLALGFLVCGVALLMFAGIDLNVTAGHLSSLRFFQAICLGLIFIPVQTLAYSGIPMELNNDASGLTNIARNIGGSIGTSLIGTLLARGAQRHQVFLVANIAGSSGVYQSALAQTRDYLMHNGFSMPQANVAAAAQIYAQLGIQANLLAYLDIIRLFAYFSLAVVPFCFIVKRPRPGQAAVH